MDTDGFFSVSFL